MTVHNTNQKTADVNISATIRNDYIDGLTGTTTVTKTVPITSIPAKDTDDYELQNFVAETFLADTGTGRTSSIPAIYSITIRDIPEQFAYLQGIVWVGQG